MTMRGRIIDGVLIITDTYLPPDADEPRRPSMTLRVFLLLGVLAVVCGSYLGWK